MHTLTFAELEQVSAGGMSCTQKAVAIGTGIGAVAGVAAAVSTDGVAAAFGAFAGLTALGAAVGGIAADFAC